MKNKIKTHYSLLVVSKNKKCKAQTKKDMFNFLKKKKKKNKQ